MVSRYAGMGRDADRTVGTPCPRGYERILLALAVIIRPPTQTIIWIVSGLDARGRYAMAAGQPHMHVTAWARRAHRTGYARAASHLSEQIHVIPADDQLLLAPLELHMQPSAKIRARAGYMFRRHNHPAVDLPELLRIELLL